MCDDKGYHVEQGLSAKGHHQQVRGVYEGIVVDVGAQQDGAELRQGQIGGHSNDTGGDHDSPRQQDPSPDRSHER